MKKKMKKKPIRHFVPLQQDNGSGEAACNSNFWAVNFLSHGKEATGSKRWVTCKNCRGTRVFRKLMKQGLIKRNGRTLK